MIFYRTIPAFTQIQSVKSRMNLVVITDLCVENHALIGGGKRMMMTSIFIT
jgi:hypothetical protein